MRPSLHGGRSNIGTQWSPHCKRPVRPLIARCLRIRMTRGPQSGVNTFRSLRVRATPPLSNMVAQSISARILHMPGDCGSVAYAQQKRPCAWSARYFHLSIYLYPSIAKFQAGNYKASATAAEKAIQLKPAHPSSHMSRPASFALADEAELAGAADREFLALVPHARASQIQELILNYQSKDRLGFSDGFRKAGLPE